MISAVRNRASCVRGVIKRLRNEVLRPIFVPLSRMDQVRAKKALGQHFLTDLNIARKIASSLGGGTAECPATVLEVGCGMGVLTQFLLQRDDIVTYGAEIDAESVEYLHEHYPDFAPRLIEGDFLKMDMRERFGGGVRVIGNFPYNISSQIFFKIIENRDLVPECVGMIQREVAVRLAEPPGSRDYGILSVLLQAWYDIEYLFTVGEKVFNPPPKVKSAVIRVAPQRCEVARLRRAPLREGCKGVVRAAPQDAAQFAAGGLRRPGRGAPFLHDACRAAVRSRLCGAYAVGRRTPARA